MPKKAPAKSERAPAEKTPAKGTPVAREDADPRLVPVEKAFARSAGFSVMESNSGAMRGLMLNGWQGVALLVSAWLASGCCRLLTSGIEPGACSGEPVNPNPVHWHAYRVTVSGCMEAPEIYAIAGQNDGPSSVAEPAFRRDYQPRTLHVNPRVETPNGVTRGYQGRIDAEYITLWVREQGHEQFVARVVHLWRPSFTSVHVVCASLRRGQTL